MAPARRKTDRARRESELLDQVLLLAMRPFLARCAEALLPRLELSDWRQPCCPLCGGEPEFAFINPAAERMLICGRCTGQWRYDPITCPYCENNDRNADHVIYQPRRPLSDLRVRRMPPVPEGLRRPRRQPPGAAGSRFDRHAARSTPPPSSAAIRANFISTQRREDAETFLREISLRHGVSAVEIWRCYLAVETAEWRDRGCWCVRRATT